MTLEVGVLVRVKRFGSAPKTAIVVRDNGLTVRVRFVASGSERTVERERITGTRKSPKPTKIDVVPPKSTRGPVVSRFKAPPVRDAKYLEYVRGRPCCVCLVAAPSDPHHFGPRGMGQKTDDRRTVPLCRRCHDEWHSRGVVEPFDRAETEREFYRAQVDALLAYDQ